MWHDTAGGRHCAEARRVVGDRRILVGVALSGPVQERAGPLIEPLRDLFAALFFVLFGLRIDIGSLPPVLGAAAAVVALSGKKQVQQAMPPVPEESVESVKEDVQWTKTRAQQGRN